MNGPLVEAEASGTTVLGKLVSDLQTNVSVANKTVEGSLNYVTDYTEFSSDPTLQSGNYLALKFSNFDARATSIKVGLVPSSIGMDLVEIINDPDRNGVFRVTSTTQKFRVVTSDGTSSKTEDYSLTGLTLIPANAQGEG